MVQSSTYGVQTWLHMQMHIPAYIYMYIHASVHAIMLENMHMVASAPA